MDDRSRDSTDSLVFHYQNGFRRSNAAVIHRVAPYYRGNDIVFLFGHFRRVSYVKMGTKRAVEVRVPRAIVIFALSKASRQRYFIERLIKDGRANGDEVQTVIVLRSSVNVGHPGIYA